MERTGKVISISKWIDSASPGRKYKKFTLSNDDGEFEYRLWEQDKSSIDAVATSYDEDRMCQVESFKNEGGFIQVKEVVLVTDINGDLTTQTQEEEPGLPTHKREQKLTPVNPKGDAIDHAVAIKEIGECFRADRLKPSDNKVIAYLDWLDKQMGVDETKPPVYIDAKGNDPSKATTKNIAALKDLLEVDDEGLDNEIALRLGYDAKMSDAEAKDWIKELKAQ